MMGRDPRSAWFDITPHFEPAQRTLTDLQRRDLPRAVVRALNRTATQVRTATNREIRKQRKLRASTVNAALRIAKASRDHLVATIHASGRPVSLKEYGARQTKKGVTVSVTGKRKLIRSAFIVAKLGGHVFQRTEPKDWLALRVKRMSRGIRGNKRLNREPIKKLFGPNIPSAFISATVQRAQQLKAEEAFTKNMAHELRRILQRAR